jgi:hypothetical protein
MAGWTPCVLLLGKAIYEVHYELNNRPDWIAIPALGLRDGCCGDPSSRMRMRRISARSLRVPNTFCKVLIRFWIWHPTAHLAEVLQGWRFDLISWGDTPRTLSCLSFQVEPI